MAGIASEDGSLPSPMSGHPRLSAPTTEVHQIALTYIPRPNRLDRSRPISKSLSEPGSPSWWITRSSSHGSDAGRFRVSHDAEGNTIYNILVDRGLRRPIRIKSCA